eukprot:scaffold19523_cov114-Isochrysis_galbana.AAC.1
MPPTPTPTSRGRCASPTVGAGQARPTARGQSTSFDACASCAARAVALVFAPLVAWSETTAWTKRKSGQQ